MPSPGGTEEVLLGAVRVEVFELGGGTGGALAEAGIGDGRSIRQIAKSRPDAERVAAAVGCLQRARWSMAAGAAGHVVETQRRRALQGCRAPVVRGGRTSFGPQL